ncbi:MAG: chitobiase/beta-hexosaminidase C-terminal domain-containing protein [Bacteroidales bacterium]|nr:chitobiase/beta-hexosaminidase C-terminal domain-containing protein [Bacteroidales bacterium]
MKRFLFKFFFVLMALIAAIPAQAKTVFFKNTNNWSTVKAHIWNGTAGTAWPGNDMTNLGDGWYCIETGDCKNIQFNGGSSDKQTGDLTIPTEQTECAYNNGWNNWSGYTLYLNHPWGGGAWGTWKKATNNYDGTFSLVEYYGGENNNTGCNYGYTENSQAGYVTDQNVDYVKSIPKNTKCTFTFDRKTNTLTITKNATQLAAPTFTPAGGTFTSAQNVTISAADGATIYYTTDGTDPTTSSTKYESAITVSKTTTIKAIAVKDGHTSSIASATYTLVEPECWYLPGASTSNAVQMTKRADGSFTLTIDIEADATFNFSKKQSTDAAYILGPTADGMYWITSEKINTDINLNLGNSTKFIMKNGAGSYTITVSADYKTVRFVKSTAQADDIPVYPAGVNSETELSTYDFEANPVYYLLSTILNNNRVTPEWQMTKGADGKYHLNGFAMRNTSCRDTDGGKNVEGYIKVRQYVDATTYKEFDKQQVNDLPENPLTDGKLYNATFDPETNKLSLTEDASAKGKMPFISLVGYMMQQDQEYITPRGIDGKPSGTTTAKGWQEAWLQYDANGKLLKDRKGNVMYSTMWPPKNPVYFTATVGENQRLYSSDQMTFVPVKDAKGDYVGKTGAEWEAELKGLDKEAYDGLDLVDDKTYYRYVVSDIWYVGAGKIWTGWGSQITYSSNNPIAQWYNHTNWGYLNKKANDTDGSLIDPETTYGVSTKDGENGNFLFENPTYFKTFEFFYENTTPSTESKIYTTRAYGSASIAAQNVKEGESYKKGSYQAKVSLPEGSDVKISSWTITRHDATTDALAPIGSDNGVVATGENTDPTSDKFTVDEEGLGEGRYYYELTVTFSNGRTSTVRSNPFVIYYPNQYSVDANGYQLVKLDTDKAIDGYSYVTYNAKANGDLYFVNLTTDNKVANFRVATSAERETVNGYFAANSGIKWTDKVFVYAPVPAEFKVDAEETNATVSLEKIVSYNVNNTSGVTPVKYELAVVDNKGDFANKVYKAVMNYKEKDIATGNWSETAKTSLGKENITMMQMPNVKAKGSVVTVTKKENSKVLDIKDGDVTKQKACNYYEVTLALNFYDPNVITAKAPRFKIGDKVYEGVNAGTHSITIACVNPLDFANAADITVDAVYYDGTGYTLPATIGEAAVLKADKAKFQVLAHPQITLVDPITSKMLGKNVVAVTEMSTIMNGADKISETELDDEYYNVKFAIDDHTTPDFSQILTKEDINFKGKLVFKEDGNYWIWDKFHWFENTTGKDNVKFRAEVTPMYVAHVTNQASTENLQIIPGETPATAEGTYVALNGNPADRTIEEGITTGVTDINTLAPRARKVIENGEIHIICGDRKYNVMGAEIR